jgi:hypothetical protein
LILKGNLLAVHKIGGETVGIKMEVVKREEGME